MWAGSMFPAWAHISSFACWASRSELAAIAVKVHAFSRHFLWARSRMAEGPMPGMGMGLGMGEAEVKRRVVRARVRAVRGVEECIGSAFRVEVENLLLLEMFCTSDLRKNLPI